MLTFLREQSKWLMILFFTLLFFSFALFFNISALDVLRPTKAGKIDGKNYTYEDFKVAVQGMSLWFQIESGGQTPDNETYRNQIMKMTWIHLALLAEAQNAGVRVSDQEGVDFIKKLPFFQKEGKYQADYYQ
ncbi:MAG: SurA N-terminal domain-containing protein, partial [Verrucomicrobiota bacterium]